MNDADFEWDVAKAKSNLAKHGVPSELARGVFGDVFAIESSDDRDDYGEERFTIIGMAHGRLLYVAYAMRGERIRIISARGAEPHEQRTYHDPDS